MSALEPIYALIRASRFDEAERALAPLLAQAPDDPAPHRAHAALMQMRGRAEEALASMRRALELAPEDASLRFALGQLLASVGLVDAALTAFAEAVALKPDFAEAWYLLGMTRYGAGRDAEACFALRRAHALMPAQPQIMRALAETEYALEHHAEALALFERVAASLAAAAQPADAMLRLRQSQCRRRLGSPQDALTVVREAVEAYPGEAPLWLELGWVHEDLGDAAAAQSAYLRAHALQPRWGDPLGATIALLRDDMPDALLQVAIALADDTRVPEPQRAFLHHALGKREDRGGRYAQAAAHWAEANRLRRAADGGFDRAAHAALIDALIASGDVGSVALGDAQVCDDDSPLFVVGMPRSGTTLVEQVIAAHPLAHGCGELNTIPAIAAEFAAAPATALTMALAQSQTADGVVRLQAEAARWLRDATRNAPAGARRLIDKMPYNDRHLGLIARLFPRARVVWCRRDPRDIALSIFAESFAPSATYATDLDDIAFVIAAHERLMRHWREVSPLPILELNYEELVANSDAQIRRLIEFAGLPWDDACLRFHASGRAVQTHSRWQVRQPVHARSVGRWRNYPQWFAAD